MLRFLRPRTAHTFGLAAVVCLAITASRLGAQGSSSISGTITDASGAAVPNASVTVKNTATGVARTIKTDGAGRYTVSALANGSYEITATAASFSTTALKGIKLDISQVLKEDIALTVGGATDEVSVEAQALTTETETSSNGQTLDEKSVAELPLANRQFYNLVQVAPGVAPPAQSSSMSFRGGMNINGAPETTNLFIVNGSWNIDLSTNQDSFRPSVDTIAEFKVLSGNYSAEYGHLQGGQILIETKRGSNKLHGSIYEFIRNGAIEARPWSPTAAVAGSKSPAFKQNTFGATLGGPVLKDKAFLFFGYEGQRIRQQITAASSVPTAFAQAGCLPGTKQVYDPLTGAALALSTTGACAGAPGLGGFDITTLPEWNAAAPAGETYSSASLGKLLTKLAYPLPNINSAAATAPSALCVGQAAGGAQCLSTPSNNYNFNETRKETMDEYNSRADYKLNDKNSFYASYNFFHDPSYEPSNSLCSSRTLPNFGCFTNQVSQLANIGEQHTFSSNLLNDIRFGWARLVQPRTQEDNTTIGTAWPGLPGIGNVGLALNLGVPTVSAAPYTATGGQTNLPQDRWDNHFQFIDTMTWTHRNHTYKVGMDILVMKFSSFYANYTRGSVSFNPATLASYNTGTSLHKGSTGDVIGDMELGFVSTDTTIPTAPKIYNRLNEYDFFVTDDWKVTHGLTLNLGLRYELDPPVTEKTGQMSTFSPSTPDPYYTGAGFANPNGSFTTAYGAGVNTVYKWSLKNFAPRVGLAWQPFGNEKTVVKSAYGIFYSTPEIFNEMMSYDYQFPIRYPKTYTPTATQTNGQITLDNPFPAELPVPGTPFCNTTTTGVCNAPAVGTTCASPCSLIPVVTGTEVSPTFSTPYVQQWTFGVQRQLTKNLLAEVLYFGNKGSKLSYGTTATLNGNTRPDANLPGVNYNLNGTAPIPLTAALLQGNRVYPQWGNISDHKTGFNSFYHSLQSRVQMSTKTGVSVLVSYTYAKAEDELTTAQDPTNQHGDKGLSLFNVKHRLVVSPVIPLPFGKGQPFLSSGLGSAILGGFQISGIWQYFGGRPFAITEGTQESGSAGGGDRPDVLVGTNVNGPDQVSGFKTRTPAEWFNVHALAYNPPGTFGTLAPNSIIGPGWDQVDITIGRTFSIKELAKLQFKVDAFNIANHPNLFNPTSTVFAGSTAFTSQAYPTTPGYAGASGTFGTITQANGMREVQASLHVSF